MNWKSVIVATLGISQIGFAQPSKSVRNQSKRVSVKNISTTLTRITNGISSQQSDQGSSKLSFSDDGRYVAFQSNASNLVSGDTNGLTDVFLFDTQTSTITKLSVGLSSAQSNGQSIDPMISGDGNYITFTSFANNLVSGDTNGKADVFRYAVSGGTIIRISVDGSATEANGSSGEPSISQNGNLIVFTSAATNLVGSDTNSKQDVFLRNVTSGATTRISASTGGAQGDDDSFQARISSDGTKVVFTSLATNLIGSDGNGCADVFLRDLSGSTTTLVSSSSAGTLGNRNSLRPDISSNGQYVVFQSSAGNLVSPDTNGYADVFLKNTSTGATSLVSKTKAGSQVRYDSINPSISLNGRFIVFESRSPDYLGVSDSNGVSDVFIHDTSSQLTDIFSSVSSSVIGDLKSMEARISGNGEKLGLASLATNLVTPDTNGKADLFVRSNPLTGQVVTVTSIGDLTENGSAQNAFTITRYGSTASSLTVLYSTGGTATSGTDYTALSGAATISSGNSSVTIPVTPLSDGIVEGSESISVSITDDAAYNKGGLDSASVMILGSDTFTVSVSMTSNIATEDGIVQGNFRISRSGGTLGDLTVNLGVSGTAVGGTDYVSISSTVLIPNGQTYVDVSVLAHEDLLGEGDETVILTINSGSGYSVGTGSPSTLTLKDNDKFEVNIQALDPIMEQGNPSDTGIFRISRMATAPQSLEVRYALRGNAQNGVDFNSLSGVATITGGNAYVDVTVTPTSGGTYSADKIVIVDLISGVNYAPGISPTVALVLRDPAGSGLPVVSITSTDAIATEDGSNTGSFRVSRTGSTGSSLVVNLSVGGSASNGADYSTIASTVTISSGQPYADVTVTGSPDAITEETESVILALQSSSNYRIDIVSSQAQVEIQDDETPVVQIFRESAYANENQSSKAKLKVTRSGSLANDLTVNLTYSGGPVAGVDFVNPGSSVTISAGSSTKTFEISAIANSDVDGNRTLTVSVGSSGSYSIGSAGATQAVIVDKTYKIFQDILSIVPNADILSPSISDDGRYVVFSSEATNLVSGDTNQVSDIFVVDTTSHTISRIMAPGSAQPLGASRKPSISGDGRYVVFSTKAGNFHQDDHNYLEDIYLYDRNTGSFTWVSKGFTQMSQGGESVNAAISSNGSFIVFESEATNLVDGDSNSARDIFLFSQGTGIAERVNLKTGSIQFSSDSQNPSVSADGKWIAFDSAEALTGDTDSFVDVILFNKAAGTTARISSPLAGSTHDGSSMKAKVSADGKKVAFESQSKSLVLNDINGVSDIFRYDIQNSNLEVISKSSNDWMGNRTSSGVSVDSTGNFGVFVSSSRNLTVAFNCTSSGFVRSVSRKLTSGIDNGSFGTCNSPVKEASVSASGKFIVSTLASDSGIREVPVSPNPLK